MIENNIYFSNLLILVEDHPVVLSLPSQTLYKLLTYLIAIKKAYKAFVTSHLLTLSPMI